MAAEYRIFADTILGQGPGAVKASSIDPNHGKITFESPMDIDIPASCEPSLSWECLNEAAEEAMEALIAKKNDDEQVWYDPKGGKHTDTGTHQREKMYGHGRVGGYGKSAEAQGFRVKPKEEKPAGPVKASEPPTPEAVAPKKRGRPRKAI